jgi:hypothetical protein
LGKRGRGRAQQDRSEQRPEGRNQLPCAPDGHRKRRKQTVGAYSRRAYYQHQSSDPYPGHGLTLLSGRVRSAAYSWRLRLGRFPTDGDRALCLPFCGAEVPRHFGCKSSERQTRSIPKRLVGKSPPRRREYRSVPIEDLADPLRERGGGEGFGKTG